MLETFDFSKALKLLKKWEKLTRLQFRDACYIIAKYPENWDDNTLPYLQMIKSGNYFPVDLSCESIFAKDWCIKR